MIHTNDPRQNRLFDPFEGIIPPAGRRIIGSGWQGVFRHVLLEVMPVGELAQHFSQSLGAPTKELYSMAGLVFLADFFDWTAEEAAEAYIFRSDVQYALNLEPGASVCPRTIERYQKLFRDNDLAAQVFHDVTTRLAEVLELNVSQQRLDSTHVFSHMANFGRTKLMAVAIKRFLAQVKRHAPESYAALPEAFRLRYQPADSQLFAGAKDAEARQRSRQQAAEDLHWIIEHFADGAEHGGPLQLQGPGHDLRPAVRSQPRTRSSLRPRPAGTACRTPRTSMPLTTATRAPAIRCRSPRRAARRTRCS